MVATSILDDVLDNPGGSRTADDQKEILLGLPPFVPKLIERLQKAASFSRDPREFVNENDAFSARRFTINRIGLKQFLQASEGIGPILRRAAAPISRFPKRPPEGGQAFPWGHFLHTRHIKGERILEEPFDEVGFPNASPAVHRDELRPVNAQQLVELIAFFFLPMSFIFVPYSSNFTDF